MSFIGRITQTIKDAGVAIDSASVPAGTVIDGNAKTVTVTPSNLQSAANTALASFVWTQAAQDTWETQQLAKTLGRASGVRVTADRTTTSAAFVDVTDLQFQLAPNSSYMFRFVGAYTAVGATTGIQLSVNGPASPTFIRFVGQIASSTIAVLNGAGGAYDAAIAGTASGGATALPFTIEGTITTGANGGAFSLRMRSETGGNTVTVLRGSYGFLVPVA